MIESNDISMYENLINFLIAPLLYYFRIFFIIMHLHIIIDKRIKEINHESTRI